MSPESGNGADWKPIPGLDASDGVFFSEYRAGPFKAKTLVVKLRSGGWLVYSPGKTLVDSFRNHFGADARVERVSGARQRAGPADRSET